MNVNNLNEETCWFVSLYVFSLFFCHVHFMNLFSCAVYFYTVAEPEAAVSFRSFPVDMFYLIFYC